MNENLKNEFEFNLKIINEYKSLSCKAELTEETLQYLLDKAKTSENKKVKLGWFVELPERDAEQLSNGHLLNFVWHSKDNLNIEEH